MLLPNKQFIRNSLLALFTVLAACGFEPVYGPGGEAKKLLGNISVSEPAGRSGFLLVQHLEQSLGRSAAAEYALNVDISVSSAGLAISRAGSTNRYNLIGGANFKLTEIATGRVVTSGRVENFTGYSATGTTTATLAASRDAEERLMIILGDQIITRLISTDLG